jgi:hypothetical protein
MAQALFVTRDDIVKFTALNGKILINIDTNLFNTCKDSTRYTYTNVFRNTII